MTLGVAYAAYEELPMLIEFVLTIVFLKRWRDDTFLDFSYAKHVRSKVVSVG